jgi:hypothetical protein
MGRFEVDIILNILNKETNIVPCQLFCWYDGIRFWSVVAKRKKKTHCPFIVCAVSVKYSAFRYNL